MKRVMSVWQVIDAFGGTKKFADIMLTTPQAVDNWRRAKLFPANTYVMLQSELDFAGLYAPNKLWAMRTRGAKKRRRRRASQ